VNCLDKIKIFKSFDDKSLASVKHHLLGAKFGKDDLLPLWVADMDFQTSKKIIKEATKRAKKGVYGYTYCNDEYNDAIVAWQRGKNNFEINKKWILFSPGVVPGIAMAIQALTEENDNVVIQTPVYYPFQEIILRNKRNVLTNNLILEDDRYSINFEELEKFLSLSKTKVLIFCNPHNPVGKMWSQNDLLKIGNLCLKYKVVVVSDEIHSDLILSKKKHFVLANLNEKFLMNTVTCTSPSKTFNLAGLQTANLIIANKEMYKKVQSVFYKMGFYGPNSFGQNALIAAYNYGEEWLENLKLYLNKNFDFIKKFLEDNLPEVRVFPLEATYLVWIDFRKLNISVDELNNRLINKAGLAMEDGSIFGKDGRGFQRMNIATSKKNIIKAMESIQKFLS